MNINFKKVHWKCGWHEKEIRQSKVCGCFHCLSIFPPSEITMWLDEDENCPRGPGKTATCPKCGIDSVLPDTIEYKITEKLLKAMQKEYFNY
ncbi:cytoplasmic protein [Desulfolithobacter dissulfuricans]|nr:cytoplasmic protein [Desulfolithobacter dissulfuricans]